MITVFVWKFRGKDDAWGHASMLVGRTYMSWWPAEPGQVPSGIHPNLYASAPFRNRTYRDDVRDESQDPDNTIEIEGLDEGKVLDWWQTFGLTRDGEEFDGPLPPWETLKQNCSTVVARGLRLGGGDTYASWWKSWNVVWTPADVLDYALSVRNGLARRRERR